MLYRPVGLIPGNAGSDELRSANFRPDGRLTSVPLNRTLSTHWTNLSVLTFSAPDEVLERHIPPGVTLDRFDGTAKVSVVGFKFHRTALCRIKSPESFDFNEVNLRTYVRGPDGTPGVVFIQELCPSRLACIVAKFLFNESFQRCSTHSIIHSQGEAQLAEYSWGDGPARNFVRMVAGSSFKDFGGGDEPTFVGGRSVGFTKSRDGLGAERFDVAHDPWRYSMATDVSFRFSTESFFGKEFTPVFAEPPSSAFIMDGSAVDVFQHRR